MQSRTSQRALTIILATFFFAMTPTGAFAQLLREEGAIYMEDLGERPVRIPVLETTAIFYDIGLKRHLGVLAKGQMVELVAIADACYRVRGRAAQGQVVGWVQAPYVGPLTKEFLDGVRADAERHASVQDLIAHKEAAVGMTVNEVQQALGKPQKKSSRMDATTRNDVWEYIRYETVPQQQINYNQNGQSYYDTIYVKVPSGRLSVVFKNGIVESLEQTEGNLVRDGRARLVVPPLFTR